MPSTTVKRERCRCNACRRAGHHGRFTLRRKLHLYKRQPRCPDCGSTDIVSVEAIRRRELAKQTRCRCQWVPFPHRRGTVLGCEHHAVPMHEFDDDQIDQYQSMLATPRSSY